MTSSTARYDKDEDWMDIALLDHVKGECSLTCIFCESELNQMEFPYWEDLVNMEEIHIGHLKMWGYPNLYIDICEYCKFDYHRMNEVEEVQ